MRRNIERLVSRIGSRLRGRRPPVERRIEDRGRVRSLVVDSAALGGKRQTLVYLPPVYDDRPGDFFPVLYLQDGQNVFWDDLAFGGHSWRAAETADRLIEAGEIEPLIIAAPFNAGEKRIGEYTPTPDRRHREGGGAAAYARFLVDELRPAVESSYRASPDPARRGVGGSSLGALVSLHVALSFPQLFRSVAALSPSIWWDDRYLVRTIRNLPFKPELRVWLDAGTAESESAIADLELLREAMTDKGWREGEDLTAWEIEGAGHNEEAWAGRFGDVLRFLYPPVRPIEN